MSISEHNLSIIIVTIKSEKIIDECIKSINRNNIPIIIVENSNNANFTDSLQKKYKNIKCILSNKNLGMGPGNNIGIKETTKTTCTGVEMFRKLLDEGRAGDNVGVLLRGTKREEVERGQVLCVPGSVNPHTHFEAEVYVLSKDEGGRHTPFFNNYRPQFYFRTTDVTGAVDLPEGVEMVMPGDNVKVEVKLINPIAMEEGLRFAIREGGRTVGAGVVSKIIE